MHSDQSILATERPLSQGLHGKASPGELSPIHALFEAQVQRSPDAIAVVFGKQSLTFRDLDRRANQLANLLRAQGVQRDTLVGICVERSLEMVVALLGILKAGGAYVPLDPAYPADRIQYVLEDSEVRLLITQQELLSSLPPTEAAILVLDPTWRLIANQEDTISSNGNTCDSSTRDLAYTIYTSGSTGKPKGVQIEHGSVVNFLRSMQREPGMRSQDVLVAVTTLSFDIAGLEMYLPLISGARLVIATREVAQDGRQLAELLRDSGATVLQATPATWRLLTQSGWQGDRTLKILCGGEALPPELARQLVARAGEVWNLYGPTETTIWSAVYRVLGNETRSVPIGLPIAETQLYLLDTELNPVPEGHEGELWIGGAGLARGYFKRPELTREKFFPDSFSSETDARMYRTGDLCRQREDGNIEFLGRLDHQIKLHGFRIELGEIEAVLEQDSTVRQAVVVAREDEAGEKFLAAYLVAAAGQTISRRSLRQHLQRALPDYMVPSAFVGLDSFPLTPNGKVDRKALSAPKPSDFDAGADYVAPQSRIETKLAAIWEEALNIRPIGVETSFFDLGGRSLVAARMFMQISREFRRDLPLALLFQSPTIRALAGHLEASSATPRYDSLIPIQPRGSRPPFFCVHGGLGGTLFLHPLAEALGADQPLYAFEPEGLDGGPIHRQAIEALAQHYIAEMRKLQPHGPYALGGYCFGGLVAFEMARQLHAVGESVTEVALFSAPLRFFRLGREATPPATLWQTFLQTKEALAEEAEYIELAQPGALPTTPPKKGTVSSLRLVQSFQSRWPKLRRKLRPRLYFAACKALVRLGLKVPQAMRNEYVALALLQAERAYKPKPYPGAITLFQGLGLYGADPDMGWTGLATTIEHIEISDGGSQSLRRDIMDTPLVKLLAKELATKFDTTRTMNAKQGA